MLSAGFYLTLRHVKLSLAGAKKKPYYLPIHQIGLDPNAWSSYPLELNLDHQISPLTYGHYMGIYNGTVAFLRYRLVGPAKSQTIARLNSLVEPHKALPLRLDSNSIKSESIGWVRPLLGNASELVDSETNWDMSDCQTAGGLLMRVRYERKKVSPSLVQTLYRRELATQSQSKNKPLTRADRQKIKDDLVASLLRKTLPSVQYTDVLWREGAQELLVFNTSRKVNERILQIFNQTFADDLGISIIQLDAASAWIENDNSDRRLQCLSSTKPAVFSRPSL